MNKNWVLFGSSDALADTLDIISSNGDYLSKIILNIPIPQEKIDRYLNLYPQSVSIISLEEFTPASNEFYNFGFFLPEKKPLVAYLKEKFNLVFTNLIHPSAILSLYAQYGEGLHIGPSSVITANATLANHARISRGATIGHDTFIGEHVFIGPSATVAGHCNIGPCSLCGSWRCFT